MTIGLALQKLLLAGLHFNDSEVDELLNKLNEILANEGEAVKRLENCIEECNQK